MKIIDIPQGDDRWHEERHGCVTGTKFESAIGACYSSAKNEWQMGGKTWAFDGDELICVKSGDVTSDSKKKQRTLLLELVSDRQSILEIDDFTSAAMERGNELEPLSIEAASKKHKVNFETCGMLQSDIHNDFKFSPDAIVKDGSGIVIGGYETKSKLGKTHIEYQLENRVPPEHLMQCLCPMVMDDCIKWWIFGHYDDRNNVNKLFSTGIIRKNYEEFILTARLVLKEFLAEVDRVDRNIKSKYEDII